MECPHCHSQVELKRDWCPRCGKRINVAFDQIAAAVHADAAGRRTADLERQLTWLLLLLVFAGVVGAGLNYLWDAKLVFDGADAPAITAPAIPPARIESIPPKEPNLFRLNAPLGQPPRLFGQRSAPLRDELRLANGGSALQAKAIEKALGYLRARQEPDGGWPVTTRDLRLGKERDESGGYQWTRTGLTALALLPFFGEGQTWLPGEDGRKGPYAECVERAVRFLVRGQDEENGRFGPADGNFMYNHGLATLALAEAAGLSGDPFLRDAAQKGVHLIERAQGPRGGWGYRDRLVERQDTSVSSWQVLALLAAREAALEVKEETLQKALAFYREAYDPGEGLVLYDLTDRHPVASLSGVGLAIRRLLGEDRGDPVARLLARKLVTDLPPIPLAWGKDFDETRATAEDRLRRARVFDPYAWFFTSQGVFCQGGEDWARYNEWLSASLLTLQDRDGAWRANDKWTVKAGGVYSTALCLLALQSYYRLP